MYRVLYVDEDSCLLDRAKQFFGESPEFIVDTSVSARDVLDSGRFLLYDAIISGYRLPDMDGVAFLKELRSRSGSVPFILFTGPEPEDVFIEALDHGADFCLRRGRDPEIRLAELVHVVKIAVDHRRAAEGLVVRNRLYSVLSATNKAIVHIRNKTAFFSEICRILVDIGEFRMVWIGLADPVRKRIEPAASFGHVDGYFDCINISTEDVPNGRGPTGTAFRTGVYNFSNDILTDPLMEPWRTPAVGRGYLASAAFPFALGTRNEGVVTLYAPRPGFFDAPVLQLLEELIRDISFALQTIDEEEARKVAEAGLKESEEKYRNLFGNMLEGFAYCEMIFDEDRKPADFVYLEVNDAFDRIIGTKTVTGRRVTEVFPGIREAFPELFAIYGRVVLTGIPEVFDIDFSPSARWLHISVYSPGKDRFVAVFEDITEQRKARDELISRNTDLNALNEELTTTQEELQQTVENLTDREHELREALDEKDVLLSEIHHRVKNNLTAFISLLSLEGAYDSTPVGLALKKDLENRARSMALIHETLYRTKKYSRVDMGVYLSTLVEQVVTSYEFARPIRTVVEADGITLDLARATPGGLIINELLTNSLKYAFPASFDCEKIRGGPCTIRVSLTRDNGMYTMTVGDNGIGLPADLDIATSKSLGLKLVNFLARHQLRAAIGIDSHEGAVFRFRFREPVK